MRGIAKPHRRGFQSTPALRPHVRRTVDEDVRDVGVGHQGGERSQPGQFIAQALDQARIGQRAGKDLGEVRVDDFTDALRPIGRRAERVQHLRIERRHQPLANPSQKGLIPEQVRFRPCLFAVVGRRCQRFGHGLPTTARRSAAEA